MFIICGDSNVEPRLLDESGVFNAAQGVIIHAGQPTYSSAGVHTELDYFVVHRNLVQAVVCCEVMDSIPGIKKHSPVVLRIRGDARSVLVDKLSTPKPYPKLCVSACHNRFCPTQAVLDSTDPQASSERHYSEWAANAEADLDSFFVIIG